MKRFCSLILLLVPLTVQAAPAKVSLADNGKALQPVIIAEKASATTKASATKLADYLQRITGAKFEVKTGAGTSGIVVGRSEDFPALKHGVTFTPNDTTKREEYLLRSHDKGLWLIGATDLAAQHAVWDFLHRIGYRQYFPGDAWEVIPNVKQLTAELDAVEKPSYHSRRIWYGFGAWDYAKEPYRVWCEKNRMV
jgi:hypothetical protein